LCTFGSVLTPNRTRDIAIHRKKRVIARLPCDPEVTQALPSVTSPAARKFAPRPEKWLGIFRKLLGLCFADGPSILSVRQEALPQGHARRATKMTGHPAGGPARDGNSLRSALKAGIRQFFWCGCRAGGRGHGRAWAAAGRPSLAAAWRPALVVLVIELIRVFPTDRSGAEVLHEADRRRTPLVAPHHHQRHTHVTGPGTVGSRPWRDRADIDEFARVQVAGACSWLRLSGPGCTSVRLSAIRGFQPEVALDFCRERDKSCLYFAENRDIPTETVRLLRGAS
jgi:hypothetical protein